MTIELYFKFTNKMATNFELARLFYQEFENCIVVDIINNSSNTSDIVKQRLDNFEELMEKIKSAKEDDDFLELVNCICQIMYFIYGTFYIFGVNFDEQLHQQQMLINNLNSLINNSIFNNVVTNEMANLIKKIDEKPKPSDSPINYTDIFRYDTGRLSRQITMLEQYSSLLTESYDDIESDPNSVLVYLQKLEIQCRSLANILGIENIDKCFMELHRANMSKGCDSEELAQKSVQYYIDKKNGDPNYKFSEISNLWIVYDKETQKVLDSVSKFAPDYIKILDLDNVKNLERNTEN